MMLCPGPVCDVCRVETRRCRTGKHTTLRMDHFRNGIERSRCLTCHIRRQSSNRQPQDDISLETMWSRVQDKDLTAPACSAKDCNLITQFNTELAKLRREVCEVCNEIGFNMKLQEVDSKAACLSCRRESPQDPALYSAANEMDPGRVPTELPRLTMAEEMLIARAHVQMQLSRVKGCQYKYTGHVISWMQNTPKIVHKLPSLPHEL